MDAFAVDVRRGLTSSPKRIDPKYFYDALGSALFTAICELPEYYVTRAEREILERYADAIARAAGGIARLVELGSGTAQKTQRVIEAFLVHQPRLTYQPIDVDATMLDASARAIAMRFPAVTVDPTCADFREIASFATIDGRTTVMFLGSSIGNLDHDGATALLREVCRILHRGDTILIGFDLEKDKEILDAAYDDPLGVTATFNRNLLVRMNRELGATFRIEQFSHRAFFNEAKGRIEMHLVSATRQTVRIGALDLEITFDAGETIHTENSYKYTAAGIDALAAAAGIAVEQQWTDARGWFADVLFRLK